MEKNYEDQFNKLKLNFSRRRSDPYINPFESGNINFDTPFSYFLKKYYNKSIQSYILHREITGDNPYDKKYIFLLQQDILITSKYEDQNNLFGYINTNPIIMKIDYKNVKFTNLVI
jgi:hypothetical protein